MDSWFFAAFSHTRIGELIGQVWTAATAYLWLIVPAGLIAFCVFWSLRYISRGAGQYGIIEGYVGTIGAGKTTLAVQHALNLATARNAVLLSNIPVLCSPSCQEWGAWRSLSANAEKANQPIPPPPLTPLTHAIEHAALPMTERGLDLDNLLVRAYALRDTQRGLVLLMDEVGVIMPARLWKDFPVSLMWLLQQSRKLACEWIWTAQDPSFVDHQLRSLTAVVHYIRSYPPPSIWRRYKGKRPWLLVASAFTPMSAPRANGDGLRPERRVGRRISRYRRRWEASFDTDGVVLPNASIKGADVLIRAAQNDRHSIRSDLGEGMGGEPEPAAGEP